MKHKRGTRLQVPAFDPRWIPSVGPETGSFQRMQDWFSTRPPVAPGEAWFMGESRKLYSYFLDGDPADLETRQVYDALWEFTSGTGSFGPMQEWTDWSAWLLPRLIPSAVAAPDPMLAELLVSLVVSQHPTGIDPEPYPGFRADLLATLGRLLMHPSKWDGGRPRLGIVLDEPAHGWWRVSGDLAGSFCLCAKYLQPEEIDDWIASLLAIDDPHWRTQLLLLLVGVAPFLDDPMAQPQSQSNWPNGIGWHGSEVLRGRYDSDHREPLRYVAFLPAANSAVIKRAFASRLDGSRIDEWLAATIDLPDVAEEAWGNCQTVPKILDGWR